MYSWRGADIRNILNFEQGFDDATVIKLEQNYRSTQNILEAANCVIKNNYGRKNKVLWTSQNAGEKIKYYRATDEKDESNYIVNQIANMTSNGDVNYSECAILYRTNAQSRVVEDSLMRNRIPYKIYGGLKFYERKEIKDTIAYLRLIQNPVDNVSLKRVINVPKRGIGAKTIEKIEDRANLTDESVFNVLLDDEFIQGFSKKVSTGLKDFASIITKYRKLKEEISISEIIENVFEESGYIDELKNEDTVESQSRIENLRELLSVANEFEKNSETGTLEEFLENIALTSPLDKMEDEENHVTLMTLHSAKGLEFPIVFLAGLEEGIFPIKRALNSDQDLEEERRLCYVGITRAEKILFLTHARMRMLYGKTNYNPISRFIDEIAGELVDRDKEAIRKRDMQALAPSVGIYRGSSINQAPKESKPASKENVTPGRKIMHDKFGIGTIIAAKNKGEDTELTIAFDNSGIKKLMLGFAPIKVM
ncbi:ATP-binding domain-containing protein [Lutibacter sp. B2]|nr:ATP-binding domain-containing protein [Lutibacter sp. B2]